jgi:pilus assembly protein CpaE
MTTDRQRAEHRGGSLVVLFGSKPGAGTSIIAANLAIALGRLTAARVILFEGHYDLGNLASLLDLAPERHIGQALSEVLAAGLLPHSSGIEVLLRAPDGTRPTPEQLRTLLGEARSLARYTVVDSALRYDAGFHLLLDEADQLLMVATPEATALRHGEQFLQQAEEWGVLPRLGVVVNRWESESGVEPAQLRALFGARIVGRLPSDGRLAVEAGNAGRPFVLDASKQPLSQAVFALAEWVHGQVVAERQPG